MARTIAANAAYPSVGNIPLRRELDDATGMGAERLIIDGKARTASASRDGTAFRGPERAACLAHSPRTGTTKKDLLRSKPQIKACSGSSGTRQRSRFRCIRLGARASFADPRDVAGQFLAANSQPQTAVTGLRSPVVLAMSPGAKKDAASKARYRHGPTCWEQREAGRGQRTSWACGNRGKWAGDPGSWAHR
jgi:hypothetical protein